MRKKEKFNNKMLNIYDEPLKKCKMKSMMNGSWDSEGKCSELGGGVHQICIKNISKNVKNFSKNTMDYIGKFSEGWDKWNGLELENQIKYGVESLIDNCLNTNKKQSKQLKKNYCKLAKNVKVLRDSDLFHRLC